MTPGRMRACAATHALTARCEAGNSAICIDPSCNTAAACPRSSPPAYANAYCCRCVWKSPNRCDRGQLSLHFDEGAQTYLQSVYGESGLQHEVTWLGQSTGVAPADLVSLQDIIHQVRPDAVIAVGARAGLTHFVASMLDATACEGSRILQVNPPDESAAQPSRVSTFHGIPDDPHTLATLRHWTGSAESVLVLFAVEPAESFTQALLQALGTLVSHRSYLVCLGTLFGQPWLGYSTHQHLRAIQDFIHSESAFVIDRSRHRQLISTCPSGYLRKVGGAVTAATYDAALDDIAGASSSFSETYA